MVGKVIEDPPRDSSGVEGTAVEESEIAIERPGGGSGSGVRLGWVGSSSRL